MEESQEKEEYKVVICGSREFNDYEFLKEHCDNILVSKRETHNIVIISGAARGADALGERYAEENGFKLIRIPADWDRFGKRAGFLRNKKMADLANGCIGFIVKDVKCSGTEMMLRISQEKNLKVRRIEYDPSEKHEVKEVK